MVQGYRGIFAGASGTGPRLVWRRCDMTLREIALVAARHSTRVAYAMRAALMALGVDADALAVAEARYGGVAECVANRVSPLDAKTARHRA